MKPRTRGRAKRARTPGRAKRARTPGRGRSQRAQMNPSTSREELKHKIETLATDTRRDESVQKLALDWLKLRPTEVDTSVLSSARLATIQEIGEQLLRDMKRDTQATIVSKNQAMLSTLKSSLTTYIKSIKDTSDPMIQSMAAALILKMNQVYDKNYTGTRGKKQRREWKPPRIPPRKTKNWSKEGRSPLSTIPDSPDF